MAKTTQLDTKVLDSILKQLNGNVGDAIAKAGFAIEARAKVKAPVDTGALRASIYTSLVEDSRANAAISAAIARNPAITPVPLPVPRDGLTAYVGPSVEYGAAIELGSASRPATPYLLPAVRETEKEFYKMLGAAVVADAK